MAVRESRLRRLNDEGPLDRRQHVRVAIGLVADGLDLEPLGSERPGIDGGNPGRRSRARVSDDRERDVVLEAELERDAVAEFRDAIAARRIVLADMCGR